MPPHRLISCIHDFIYMAFWARSDDLVPNSHVYNFFTVYMSLFYLKKLFIKSFPYKFFYFYVVFLRFYLLKFF
jgi:hypothetical protein